MNNMKHITVNALILSALLLCAHAQPNANMNTTEAPTMVATEAPTIAVTEAPTMAVPDAPTEAPTELLTAAPSQMPSMTTDTPIGVDTPQPSVGTLLPSTMPTALEETVVPTGSSTTEPSTAPSLLTESPPSSGNTGTTMPSDAVDTSMPTDQVTDLPTLSPTVFDDEAPTRPGTPRLTGQLASTTASFQWTASMDNIAVKRYDIYDGTMLVGETKTSSFTAADLESNEQHSFTVVALDAAGNESPASNPLVVHTLVLVDDFDDKDNVAEDDWGLWLTSCGGTLMNGGSSLQYLEGVNSSYSDSSFGARLDYEVDGGETGFCNLFLAFDESRYKEGTSAVDLTASNITGVQFQFKGSEGSTVYLQLGTPLAEFNNFYYRYELMPTSDWETISVNFGEFVAQEGVPYTLSDALESATTVVWEVNQVGRVGWFMLDNVDFRTTASHPQDVTSGAVGRSLVASLVSSMLVVGIGFL